MVYAHLYTFILNTFLLVLETLIFLERLMFPDVSLNGLASSTLRNQSDQKIICLKSVYLPKRFT